MGLDLTGLQAETTALQTKVNDQDLVIQGITGDYATMQQQITDLEAAQGDASASQVAINALKDTVAAINQKLASNTAEMVALDESVAPAPPVTP